MPRNGERNEKFGVYKSLCCGAEIVINPGATFPDCPHHQKLTTIWKPLRDGKIDSAATQKSVSDAGMHVENRRLFDFVSGQLKLEEWENNHLHECRVCQGIVHVFTNQPTVRPGTPPKPADAA